MNKGTYCLILLLAQDRQIAIGQRKRITFPRGYYVYVGSALNNLAQRIKRHCSSQKRRRWHIDWLLDAAVIVNVMVIPSPQRWECALSQRLAVLSQRVVMKGFGSSDCACLTHLHYFEDDPTQALKGIMARIKEQEATGEAIRGSIR